MVTSEDLYFFGLLCQINEFKVKKIGVENFATIYISDQVMYQKAKSLHTDLQFTFKYSAPPLKNK